MKTKKIYYVYMRNNTDSRDDEIFKVKAIDDKDAKRVALEKQFWPGRFSVGEAVSARPKSNSDKQWLRANRWWASDKTK